jgi:hypothetical protein
VRFPILRKTAAKDQVTKAQRADYSDVAAKWWSGSVVWRLLKNLREMVRRK